MNLDVARSLAKNTTILMGSQVITGLLSFVLMLFLPRMLGTEEYGRLYLAMSIQAIFVMVILYGGRYYIVKEIARSKDVTPALVADSMVARVMLWGVSFAAMVGFAFLAGYPTEIKVLIFILGVSMLWEGARLVLYCTFQAHEAMKYPSIGSIVERIFVATAAIIALMLGARAGVIAAIMAVGTMLNYLLCRHFFRRMVPTVPKGRLSATLNVLKVEFPYFLLAIFGVIYFRIDAVMLSLMTNETVVGWYGAAYRFFDILMFFPSIFITALFPVLSRLWGKENGTLARTAERSIELMLLAGIPIAVIVFAFAREIIDLFFGLADYGQSVLLLQIFAVGLLIIYINFILGTTVFASDKQRRWSFVTFIAVIINVILNYFMIPYTQLHLGNGGIGSAVATLLTEFYIMTSAVSLLSKNILKEMRIAVWIKGAVAGLIMIAAVWLIRTTNVHWILQSSVGLIVYLLSISSLRVLHAGETEFLKSYLTMHNLRKTFVPQKGTQA